MALNNRANRGMQDEAEEEERVDPITAFWRRNRRVFYIAGAVLALWIVAARSYVVVPNGSKAVILEFGHINAVVPDGLHIIKPWSTSRLMSVQVLKSELKAEAVSKDTQKVATEVIVNWTFKPDKLDVTYTKVGLQDDMRDTIMIPALNESLKAVTARYPVAEILSKREQIKQEIDDKFRSKLETYEVNIIDIYLTNLRFDPEYEKAIEDKQVAQVRVTTAMNNAEAARQTAHGEADSVEIRAKGEAKAKSALASTLSSANLQLEWIKAWAAGGSHVPQIITSNGGGSNFMLDLSKLQGTK